MGDSPRFGHLFDEREREVPNDTSVATVNNDALPQPIGMLVDHLHMICDKCEETKMQVSEWVRERTRE